MKRETGSWAFRGPGPALPRGHAASRGRHHSRLQGRRLGSSGQRGHDLDSQAGHDLVRRDRPRGMFTSRRSMDQKHFKRGAIMKRVTLGSTFFTRLAFRSVSLMPLLILILASATESRAWDSATDSVFDPV